MFGSQERLEKKLREGDGKTATAEVTATKKGIVAISSGGDTAQLAASAHVNWKVTLQIAPDDGAPFQVTVTEPYPELGAGPSVGDKIGVLYDPNDHSKVAIDHSSEGEATNVLSNIPDRTQAAMAQIGGESAHDMMKEAIDNPAEFRARMQERTQQMAADAVASARAGLPQYTTNWMQAAGAGAGAAPAAAPDPADELTKLANLKDRGAITEAEFEAQKKKLLGS
jgi:hypothetical protein